MPVESVPHLFDLLIAADQLQVANHTHGRFEHELFKLVFLLRRKTVDIGEMFAAGDENTVRYCPDPDSAAKTQERDLSVARPGPINRLADTARAQFHPGRAAFCADESPRPVAHHAPTVFLWSDQGRRRM